MLQIWKLHSNLCYMRTDWPRSVSKSASKFASLHLNQHQQTQPHSSPGLEHSWPRLPHHLSHYQARLFKINSPWLWQERQWKPDFIFLCVLSPPAALPPHTHTEPPHLLHWSPWQSLCCTELHNCALAVHAGWTVCIRNSYTWPRGITVFCWFLQNCMLDIYVLFSI